MKQIEKFLKKAFEGKDATEAAKALGLNDIDFQKLLKGELEITPKLAVAIGSYTETEPRDLMDLVTEQALVAAGAGKRKPKEVATRDVSKTTGTDGRPSQSPMTRERSMATMSFSGAVSVDKAQRSVEAVSRILAE